MTESRRTKKKPRRAVFARSYEYADGESPMDVYLSALGEDSQRTMGSALESIADMFTDGRIPAGKLAWHALRSQHVSALRGRLQKLYAPSTGNRYLSALRAVLKEAWRLELVDRDTMERTMDVAPIKGSRSLRGRAITEKELREIFAACASDENRVAGPGTPRSLHSFTGAGLRRAEAAAVELENLDRRRASVRLLGKGNKERRVFLPRGAVAALEAWLLVRGTAPGPLFAHVTKSGKVRLRAVTPQLIYRVVEKRHLTAGIKPFTPHDMRRTHISDLLDEGIDLSTVAKQVGHSNVQTTARYDRRDERAQHRAASRLNVPFHG